MTRLSSAPSPTELAPDVYEASLRPLEYLAIEDVPSYADVQAALVENGTPLATDEQLVVVPPALEAFRLSDWDLQLRVAFGINQAVRGTKAHMPGLTISNLVIHETFRRYSPDLAPEIPTIATTVPSCEKRGRNTAMSFATYVLYQLGLALDDKDAVEACGTKTAFTDVRPTLFEAETFDRWKEKTQPDGTVTLGDSIIKNDYDVRTKQNRVVIPVAAITSPKGQDALTASEAYIWAARWGSSVEMRNLPYTPETAEELREWVGKYPHVIEETRCNPGHKAIAVLPHAFPGLPRK